MPLISTENKRYLQGQARRERYEQYKEALQYCKDNGCGAKDAIKTGQWNDVQVQALQQRLKGHVVNGAEDETRSLLLFVEEQQLMKWIKECGDNMMGRNRPDVQAKILEILKERKGRLRATRGKGYTKLSTAAQDLLERSIPTIHSHWFQRFYGFWHFEIWVRYAHQVRGCAAISFAVGELPDQPGVGWDVEAPTDACGGYEAF